MLAFILKTVVAHRIKLLVGVILLALACAGAYVWGYTSGINAGTKEHTTYVNAQTAQTVKVAEQQVKVITRVETVYRDRVQKIYLEGKTIETLIPNYIQPADDALFAVPVGLVRVVDAAWSGQAPGPATSADREPSGIPLADLATVQVGNITSCHLWRDQAVGWRQFYAEQQGAINGASGDWYRPTE